MGKHAKRSNNRNTVTAAAVLGIGAVALPLVESPSAGAATVATWEKIAQCESGGRWNGAVYQDHDSTGGLQIRDVTWHAFGGDVYASSAWKATKEQQITIAQKILAAQGSHAWSVTFNGSACSGVALAVDPVPSFAGGSPPPPAPHSSSEHPAPPPIAPSKDNDGESAPPVAVKAEVKAAGYTVKVGDWLAKLAQQHYGDWRRWPEIYAANRDKIKNPNLIYPGQVLALP